MLKVNVAVASLSKCNNLRENSFNNHFLLFDEPETFCLDILKLDSKRKELLTYLHPDRFTGGTSSEKKLALQWTTKINEAHTTLKDPAKRAIYLCKLTGIILEIEKSTAFSMEILEEQMDLREKLSEIVETFSNKNFDLSLLDGLEKRANSMLSRSVETLEKLFKLDYKEDKKILQKIESQVNLCLFSQKFTLECFEVRRRFL